MKKSNIFVITLFILLIQLSCNLTFEKPYTGISPLLTATAMARQQASGISPNPLVQNQAYSETQIFYRIQSGDTLDALCARFEVDEENILYPDLSRFDGSGVSTLSPNDALVIDLQRKPDWPEPIRILPDNYFIYGPTQTDFNTEDYIRQSNGWLAKFEETAGGVTYSGIDIVANAASNYSISPRLLLSLLEYRLQALTNPIRPKSFSLGSNDPTRKTLGKHLSWAANTLNNGYYGWRSAALNNILDANGNSYHPNPASNAGSIAIFYYFSQFVSGDELNYAVSDQGFMAFYRHLFGDVDWSIDSAQPIIPANLSQPDWGLPLQPGLKWAYTGGPHSGWGTGYPYAAIDFAPPATVAGCEPSPYWVSAAADGKISRLADGLIFQDLDGDGYSQTGWVIQYLHLAPIKPLEVGMMLSKGEKIGYPSCLGGSSSGRNFHIARRYNGEWIAAAGSIPLDLGGWIAVNGEKEYKGSLVNGQTILKASSVGEYFSQFPIK